MVANAEKPCDVGCIILFCVVVLLPKLLKGLASFPPITLAENDMGVVIG